MSSRGRCSSWTRSRTTVTGRTTSRTSTRWICSTARHISSCATPSAIAAARRRGQCCARWARARTSSRRSRRSTVAAWRRPMRRLARHGRRKPRRRPIRCRSRCGSLVQKAGGLDLTAETVDEEDVEYGAYVSVSIRRGEELVERVAFERTYGRWAPTARRTITHLTDDRSFERLDGALSDPFPSGDVIVGQYRR